MIRDHRIKVLFLASNPVTMSALRLAQEVRQIEEKIGVSKFGDSIEFIVKWAARPDDLQQTLLDVEPHIVHFSGHGSEREGLYFESPDGISAPVDKKALVELFRILKGNIRFVMLNACKTHTLAEAITTCIDCAVGSRADIGDEAAVEFSSAFYRGIGFGKSVKMAFDLACCALRLKQIPEDGTPELHVRAGVDPADITFGKGSGKAVPELIHRPERDPDRILPRPTVRPSPPNRGCSPPGNQELVMLLLAANTDRLARLRCDREVRQIQERLLATRHGRAMIVHVRWAVRPDDLLHALLDLRPRIVHLSGYAMTPHGLLLEDDAGAPRPASDSVLADLFGVLRDQTRLVVLNASDSQSHAEAITRHVDAAIGMSRPVEDATAIEFASAFYQAIGSGLTLGDAFELAQSALRLNGLPGADIPMLFLRTGVDLSRTILFEPTERLAGTAAVPCAHDHGIPASGTVGAGDRSRGSASPACEPGDLLVTTAELLAAACPDEGSFVALLSRVGVSSARIPTLRSLQARCECLLLDLAHAERPGGLNVLADALSCLDRPGIVAAAAVRRFAAAGEDNGPNSMDALWISLCRRGDGWMLEFRAPRHACSGTVGSARSARVPIANETVFQVDVKEAGVTLRVQAGVESPLIGLKARVWTGLTTLSKHLIPWFDERLGPAETEEFTLLEAATTWSELDAA